MPSLIQPFGTVGTGSIPDTCPWDGEHYEDFNIHAVPCTALLSFAINRDGTFDVRQHNGFRLATGNWFEPTTTDAGDDYEVRLTAPSGTFGGTVTNPFSSWTAITSDRIATFQTTFIGMAGGEKESEFTATCEIRPTGGSVVLTGEFTVLLNASTTP